MKPKWGVVVNKNAGRGKTQRFLPVFEKALQENGIDYILVTTDSIEEIQWVFERFSQIGIDAVISVGGDGTANNLAPYLLKNRLPLLIIPMGTGNDYARALYGEIDWREILKRVGEGKTKIKVVDTGLLEIGKEKNIGSMIH